MCLYSLLFGLIKQQIDGVCHNIRKIDICINEFVYFILVSSGASRLFEAGGRQIDMKFCIPSGTLKTNVQIGELLSVSVDSRYLNILLF